MVHPLCDRHFRSAYSLRCRRAGLWSLSGRIIGPKCIRRGTVVPLRPQNRPVLLPERAFGPLPVALLPQNVTVVGLRRTHLRQKCPVRRISRRRVRRKGRLGRKPCRVCNRNGLYGRFAANASAMVCRKCVRRTDQACVLVDKRQRREVVRSKTGMGRWSMVSTNLVCTGEVASTEGSLYKPGRNRRFRPLSGRFVHEMREWRGNRRTNEVCTRWGDEDERLMND